MTTSSAAFEFSTDGGSVWKASDLPLTGANALALSGSPIVLKARLTSLAGVHTVVWTVTTADDLTIEAGPLPVPVQASDKSATLTIPGTGGRSYVLEAFVNGDALLKRRLAVHVKTSNNLEVISAGEFDEANRTYGWTGNLNAAIRAIAAGGGGGGAPLADAAPPDVAGTSAVGVSTDAAREDHTHKLTVGGATPASGAITFTAGGTTGVVATPSGNDVAFRIGVTSQAAGDLVVATSGTAWARHALGSADAQLGVNGAGTGLAYTLTPWLSGARFGIGGSTAANVFGTATVMVGADSTGGEGLGIKADTSSGKGRVAFYDTAEAAAGFVGYDETNTRFEIGSSGKAWRLTSDAGGTKIPLLGEAGNANVGLCGGTIYGGGVDVVTIGLATTAPTSVPANSFILANSAGAGRLYAASQVSVFPGGTTERARIAAAAVGINTNLAVGSLTGSFGSGANVISLVNGTAPSTNPTGGGILYATGGEPLWRTSGGAIRAMLTAGGSGAAGLFVAASSGGAVTTQLNKRTITLSDGTTFDVLTP